MICDYDDEAEDTTSCCCYYPSLSSSRFFSLFFFGGATEEEQALITSPTSLLHGAAENNCYYYLSELLAYEFHRAKNRRRFSYLRCLAPVDRRSFQAEMICLVERNCADRALREAMVAQGSMRLRTWRNLMRNIPMLAVTYKLWRPAYWGECAAWRPSSSSPHWAVSSYHVLVETFHGQGSATVDLLFSDGRLTAVPDSLLFPTTTTTTTSRGNNNISDDATYRFWREIST